MSKQAMSSAQIMTRRSALTLAASSFATLTGCNMAGSQAQSNDTSNTSQVVVVMNPTSEPSAGFDPIMGWGCGEHVHEPLIQSTLVITDTDLSIQPSVATEYHCSDDGLTWNFTLRDDVVFSDGEPLRASDAAFTINMVNNTPGSQADLSVVKDARALSDTELELTLTKPYNALLYTLAVLGIVPEHAYDDSYGSHPIGSGPFVLEQWDRGQQAIFRPNPHFVGDAPKIERLVVVFMDEDAALASVGAGEADIAYTYATHAEQSYEGYELISCDTVDSRGFSLPCVPAGDSKTDDTGVVYAVGNDVTSNLEIRRAINMAIDRDALIQHVLNGYGSVAYSVCDGLPWASEDMAVSFDRNAAKELLEQADWTVGLDGIRERNGLRASFELWYSSDDSVRQAMVHEISNQLAEVGIEVVVHGGSWDELYERQYAQAILWGWGSNSPIETYELNYSTGWGNYSSYTNETVDKHLNDALAQPTMEASYEHWKAAMWDGHNGVAPKGAATWCWVANVEHLYFKRPFLDIGQQKPHPHGHGWSLLNNVAQWSWRSS